MHEDNAKGQCFQEFNLDMDIHEAAHENGREVLKGCISLTLCIMRIMVLNNGCYVFYRFWKRL